MMIGVRLAVPLVLHFPFPTFNKNAPLVSIGIWDSDLAILAVRSRYAFLYCDAYVAVSGGKPFRRLGGN
jgi:hypothetical protein